MDISKECFIRVVCEFHKAIQIDCPLVPHEKDEWYWPFEIELDPDVLVAPMARIVLRKAAMDSCQFSGVNHPEEFTYHDIVIKEAGVVGTVAYRGRKHRFFVKWTQSTSQPFFNP